MNNERIISVSPVEEPEKTSKNLNLKLLFGIIGGVLALAAIITVAVVFLSDKAEFSENGGKNLPNVSESKYVNLENYDVSFENLASFYEDEVQEKITLFFTYAYPNLSTLTVKEVKTYDEEKKTDYPDELDSMNPYKTTELKLSSDTRENFTAKIRVDYGTYELTIFDANNIERYTYTGGDITKDLYASAEYDSLLDVILDKLPYTGELEGGAKFEITYEGEEGDRLTVSPSGGSLSTEDCKKALSAAAEWANSLGLKYSKEITENNFSCKL